MSKLWLIFNTGITLFIATVITWIIESLLFPITPDKMRESMNSTLENISIDPVSAPIPTSPPIPVSPPLTMSPKLDPQFTMQFRAFFKTLQKQTKPPHPHFDYFNYSPNTNPPPKLTAMEMGCPASLMNACPH